MSLTEADLRAFADNLYNRDIKDRADIARSTADAVRWVEENIPEGKRGSLLVGAFLSVVSSGAVIHPNDAEKLQAALKRLASAEGRE